MTLTPSAPPPSPGIVRIVPFAALVSRFDELIVSSSSMVLYFIHSRRWRENHATAIKNFMAKEETTLEEHFEDGPLIPALVEDAYRYFARLARDYQKGVQVRLFGRYPTYSFYRFDDRAIMAMYSNSVAKKELPAFEVTVDGFLGAFLAADIEDLRRECRVRNTEELEAVITNAGDHG